MGCNIHTRIELVDAAGQVRCLGIVTFGRSYHLFALMAGVRNYPERVTTIAVAEPRGLPEDASD